MRAYMQRRAARRIEFDFPDPAQIQEVNINPPLFKLGFRKFTPKCTRCDGRKRQK